MPVLIRVPGVLGKFDTEDEAKAHLVEILSPYFELFPEARVIHALARNAKRIDFIAVARDHGVFPRPLFGIEVKSGYHDFRDVTRALAQAMDYRQAEISDSRLRSFTGQKLPLVFVYPEPQARQGWFEGAIRLAGQFQVGTIREELTYWSDRERLRFTLCGERYWSSDYGARGGSETWGAKLKVGRR